MRDSLMFKRRLFAIVAAGETPPLQSSLLKLIYFSGAVGWTWVRVIRSCQHNSCWSMKHQRKPSPAEKAERKDANTRQRRARRWRGEPSKAARRRWAARKPGVEPVYTTKTNS